MNINELTIGQAKEIASIFGLTAGTLPSHPFEIGANYFLRTVTHHHTGKLVAVTATELVLENAAWIADDGRLNESLKTGSFNEVEMFPADSKVIIGRGSLIDAVKISAIPVSTK